MSGAGGGRTSAVAPAVREGRLADGTAWRIAVPRGWGGVLVSDADLHGGPQERALDDWCLQQGMAVARTSRDVSLWRVARAVDNRIAVHELLEGEFGRPARVVATGASLGGLMTRALVQDHPDLVDGGVAMNGGGAGTVAMWNVKLDAGLALDTLVGGEGQDPAQLRHRIRDPAAVEALLARARQSAAGRARLALAAAFALQPVWSDPGTPEPAAGDLAAMADGMTSAMDSALAPFIVDQIESIAGGSFSWNTDVDYVQRAAGLGEREPVVRWAYEVAGLSLEDDVARLNDAARFDADPEALAWAERNRIWRGDLPVPIVTMYAVGDPAAVPEEEDAYARSVAAAGASDRLQQVFLRAAGHCRFTTGECAAAIEQLLATVERRPGLRSSAERNEFAADVDKMSEHDAGRPAAFFDYRPGAFPRPYDHHDASAQSGTGAATCRG